MTSAELARCMNTNAVVVRRTMARASRGGGFVRSEKGARRWMGDRLRPLSAVTLKDVYDGVGIPDNSGVGHPAREPGMPGRAGGQSVPQTMPFVRPKRF